LNCFPRIRAAAEGEEVFAGEPAERLKGDMADMIAVMCYSYKTALDSSDERKVFVGGLFARMGSILSGQRSRDTEDGVFGKRRRG